MSTEDLLEDAVIADFQKDADLLLYPIHRHDYAGSKSGDDIAGQEESKATITVTARDNGEQGFGVGARRIVVEVEIRANLAADNGAFTLLSNLADKAATRLQPSTSIQGVTGRENNFSTDKVRVLGIEATPGFARTNQQLERIRTIQRQFVVVRIAA